MKAENLKVFIVHGYEGSPNGGWRPWLMRELAKEDIYCGSLSMPGFEKPKCKEWIKEIENHVKRFPKDKIILVGHSLGVPTILSYLQTKKPKNIIGCVLAAGPYMVSKDYSRYNILKGFFPKYDWNVLEKVGKKFAIVHGTNDKVVNFSHALYFTEKLKAKLYEIKGAGHLNGSSGCYELPEALSAIKEIILKNN